MKLKNNNLLKIVTQHYNTIVDQCFAHDGKSAIAFNTDGCFFHFSTSQATSSFTPTQWNVSFNPLCLDKLDKNFLICGDTEGRIHVCRWPLLTDYTIKNNKNFFLHESLTLANSEILDIMCLSYDKPFQNVVIGCGNGSIKLCDLELKKVTLSIDGVSNRINKIVPRRKKFSFDDFQTSEFEFFSCSNDGKVYLWDIRTGKSPSKTINVASSKNSQIFRKNFSKSIRALDVDDDFMVCGGGIALGLWHLGSESLICKLLPKNKSLTDNDDNNVCDDLMLHETAEMFNSQISVGGRTGFSTWHGTTLQKYNYTGEHLQSLKLTGINGILSISTYSSKKNSLTLVAGESSQVFCLSDSGYFSHSIDLNNSITVDNLSNDDFDLE